MSEHSLIIALKYGEKLKEFDDIAQAEKYFISYKDELLNRLEAISGVKGKGWLQSFQFP